MLEALFSAFQLLAEKPGRRLDQLALYVGGRHISVVFLPRAKGYHTTHNVTLG